MAGGDIGHLGKDTDDKVHDGTDGSKVEERDEGVHLVLGAAEQALHHEQTGRLEDDAAGLEEDADEDEVYLAKGGNNNTDHDDGDVEEDLEIGGRKAHCPRNKEHADGRAGLADSQREWREQQGRGAQGRTLSIWIKATLRYM